MDMENRLVVAMGEEEGVGWPGVLGLVDANFTFRVESNEILLYRIRNYNHL